MPQNAVYACEDTAARVSHTNQCSTGVYVCANTDEYVHTHGSVLAHTNCHLAHFSPAYEVLKGNCAFGLRKQASCRVRVRICTCLLYVHGVMYTRVVVRRFTVARYDTHSACEAYHCDIQRECNDMFYRMYSNAIVIVEWRHQWLFPEEPFGTKAVHFVDSISGGDNTSTGNEKSPPESVRSSASLNSWRECYSCLPPVRTHLFTK